ncbi:MAG: class I SAM-dependent methyltransferase [Bdellovibrionia bacterium]
MSSRFDPHFYSLYRPFYPAETFAGLTERLCRRGLMAPHTFADIGCGTGHSTISLIRSEIQSSASGRVIGIDPDALMLDEARRLSAREQCDVEWRLGRGEATGLEPASVDAILIGSAFHWMKAGEVKAEVCRVLKRGGILRIFEYQFPKAVGHPELNEWIRREFNLRWKAPEQKPRGSLKELTSIFRDDPEFEFLGDAQPKMEMQLDSEQLTGLILSQSRVLHFEDNLKDQTEIQAFRNSVRSTVGNYLAEKSALFDFKLAWMEFGLRARGIPSGDLTGSS